MQSSINGVVMTVVLPLFFVVIGVSSTTKPNNCTCLFVSTSTDPSSNYIYAGVTASGNFANGGSVSISNGGHGGFAYYPTAATYNPDGAPSNIAHVSSAGTGVGYYAYGAIGNATAYIYGIATCSSNDCSSGHISTYNYYGAAVTDYSYSGGTSFSYSTFDTCEGNATVAANGTCYTFCCLYITGD